MIRRLGIRLETAYNLCSGERSKFGRAASTLRQIWTKTTSIYFHDINLLHYLVSGNLLPSDRPGAESTVEQTDAIGGVL